VIEQLTIIVQSFERNLDIFAIQQSLTALERTGDKQSGANRIARVHIQHITDVCTRYTLLVIVEQRITPFSSTYVAITSCCERAIADVTWQYLTTGVHCRLINLSM